MAGNIDDTIVAIATPPGRGGIGVVRIAGPRAMEIAQPMLRLKHEMEPGRAVFGELIEPGPEAAELRSHGQPRAGPKLVDGASVTLDSQASRIDEVVVTHFAKPHSYTTDDIVEIAAHGSPVVLRHIVEMCVASGARLAEPGEFTLRAFLNGRIDLTQAEAVRDLIDSQTLYQAKVAAQQLEGSLSRRLQPIKRALVELIATLEAGIDFAEDDVSVMADHVILDRISSIQPELERLAASFSYGKLVHQGLTLAIVGRPNVGKSSLFNRLVERDRAIVTSTPGTTRDLVSETVAIGGIPVQLVDTAGLRQAVDEAESIGIRKSREAMTDADLVLVVLDASQDIQEQDRQLLQQVQSSSAIVVANKCDLESCSQTLGAREELSMIRVSALTGEGMENLRAKIFALIEGGASGQTEAGFITNVRHAGLVQDSLAGLIAATNAVANHVPHEMLLLDLYAALRPLDAITGATTTDDILNLIFSTFCIGK